MVARLIEPERRPTIVYESTVYLGVTEEICGPEIDAQQVFAAAAISVSPTARKGSIQVTGSMQSTGSPRSSPVRIGEVVQQLAQICALVTSGGAFRADWIRVAEAAKAIENAALGDAARDLTRRCG